MWPSGAGCAGQCSEAVRTCNPLPPAAARKPCAAGDRNWLPKEPISASSKVTPFKLEPDGHSAKRVVVQFGATSVNLIEIKSGLQPGGKVIISDMSKYDGVAAIVLR